MPEGLWESLRENVELLESSLDREFGSSSNPLLVSVRSGAPVSMPGMMDTILNLGINDQIVEGLARLMDNPRAATMPIAVSSRSTPPWFWTCPTMSLRASWATPKLGPRFPSSGAVAAGSAAKPGPTASYH